MLFIYDKKKSSFAPSQETDFKTHEIMERRDIERWVIGFPEILGEDMLVITTEYDKFDRTKERLDLLNLDKNGKLVIVELKRDESGKSTELQAIKYAAYCSTLVIDDVIAMRKKHLERQGKSLTNEEIEKELFDFIENEDFEQLDDKPRIMLVAKDFRPEVTTAVLWLRKFGIDLSCVKLSPYKIDEDRIGLVSSILIPLPQEVVGDHQTVNAYEYAKSGAAIIIEQANLEPNIFLNQLKKIFSEPGKLAQMSQAARNFAKPEAARVIAEEILKLGLSSVS